MKKIIFVLLLAVALVLSSTACAGNGDSGGNDITLRESESSTDITAGRPGSSFDTTANLPATSENQTVPEDTDLPSDGDLFIGEHEIYITNGAYGRYYTINITKDSEKLNAVPADYSVTEFDGSGAINTAENEYNSADFEYAVSGRSVKIKFSNFRKKTGSDVVYWFTSVTNVRIDGNAADFDYEGTDVIVIEYTLPA